MTAKMWKNIDLQGNKITGSADPSVATDLVTLQYLQNFLNGIDWKSSVRVAATGNVNVASPGASIDGVAMSSGDRVLLPAQTTASENGLWQWNGASVAMTRTTDADSAGDITSGMAVFVEEGTANGDKAFVLITNNPITIGTTALTFTQFGGGTLPVAGAGLTLTGSTIDVGSGNGILVNADSIQVDPAVVPRKFDNGATHAASSPISLTHNLGHRKYQVTVCINSTGEDITNGVEITRNLNSVDVAMSPAPAANTILIMVEG